MGEGAIRDVLVSRDRQELNVRRHSIGGFKSEGPWVTGKQRRTLISAGEGGRDPVWLEGGEESGAPPPTPPSPLNDLQAYYRAENVFPDMVFISFFSISGRARFSTLRKSDVLALMRVWM